MKLLQSLKNRWRGILAIVLLFTATTAGMLGANVLAWGPSRDLFTIEKPATYVTFNSITNNPMFGDETNFMQVREVSSDTYTDKVALTPGKEYIVSIYYHNNAAENFNASGVGIAKGAYVRAEVPSIVRKGSTGTKANGFVGAENAKPLNVFDDIAFTNATGADIALSYVPGSTTIFNRVEGISGTKLPDTVLSKDGVKIGYDKLDGIVPGCNEYSGYVTFRIKADQPNFTFSKQVRVVGEDKWSDEVSTKVGTEVEYRLDYKNTGTTEQKDVVLKDKLPQGVTYINGSSKLYNGNNPNGKVIGDGISTSGVNIGGYLPGANAILTFRAKITGGDMVVCGITTFTNTAGVETRNGNKQDSAKVKVTKECKKPIEVCDLDSNKIIKIEEDEFDKKKHSKNLKDCQTIKVCEIESGKIVEIAERNFDKKKYSKNLKDCQKINVCEIETGKIVEVIERDFDKKKHSKNLKDCDAIEVCDTENNKIIAIYERDFDGTKHSKDTSDCDAPAPVTELPRTGPAEMLLSTLALAVLTISAVYYFRSRKVRQQAAVAAGTHATSMMQRIEAFISNTFKR